MRLLLFLTLPLYLLDQVTKWWILQRFELGGQLPVVTGFFDLVHVANTGAAFGIGSGNNLFFVVLSAIAILVLAWLARKEHLADVRSRIGAALLVAGILGNLTDRLLHGHVVDFLSFHVSGHYWPAFNVADSCICIAAGLFLWSSFVPFKAADQPQ